MHGPNDAHPAPLKKQVTDKVPRPQGSPKTSPPIPPSPRATAQGGIGDSPTSDPAVPRSPAFSTSSTFDGSDGELSSSSSALLPSLPLPQLPERAREHLRSVESPQPPSDTEDNGPYVTASWGSPYPPNASRHLRRQSFSSEPSDDSPIHQLEINTPFLRAVPAIVSPTRGESSHQAQLSETAAVLVNRARRPVLGITEDWIRAHTTNDLTSEHRHWFSDGSYSEHSSLSGSISGDDSAWFEEADPRTPRASKFALSRAARHVRNVSQLPRLRSSNETLRQPKSSRVEVAMETIKVEAGKETQDTASIHTLESPLEPAPNVETPQRDRRASLNDPSKRNTAEANFPATPTKPTKPALTQTPRLKKKVPWKGKNIMVHLPRDDERGQAGKGVLPLTSIEIEEMVRSWKELGYNTRGFDLDAQFNETSGSNGQLETYSQSRNAWPNQDDISKERALRKYQVTLPDLNAWKMYQNELMEAKLRALGVSLGEDEPAQPPSISPAPSNLSQQVLNQYPPLPFSPPLPTSSAASAGPQGFPFPGAFSGTSATQSPAVPSVASPLSFNGLPGKFNPRASISISPSELPFHFLNSGQPSPHGWSPQAMLLQQQLGRTGSPSLLNMNSMMSPQSPFSPEGAPSPLGLHQRHQSMQLPMLPHAHIQRLDSARASPRLQELREVDEEIQSNPYENRSPSKTPEPGHFIRHNASESLQKEIDDAEYHLEEQFREQLEHEDYSPHHGNEKIAGSRPIESNDAPLSLHGRGPSVHFGNLGGDSDEGPVLHHPRPHSRGHSLTQKPFFDTDELRDSTDEATANQSQIFNGQKDGAAYEIGTNPSYLGTPVSTFDLVNQSHQRSFSTATNPWADVQSMNGSKPPSRRSSHASKPSLSKLNASASEFKFNPTSSFTPGLFNFGAPSFQPTASAFQPAAFQASTFMSNAQSTASSHFSVPSTSSSKGKINAAAPVFSPRQSEFSFPGTSDFNFSASGPKFNPDAPTFQPIHAFTPSVTSGSAFGKDSTRPDSIFSNISISAADVVKPAKRNKAIPIVRPTSRHSQASVAAASSPPADTDENDADDRLTDVNRRTKKSKNVADDGDDVPRFAEPTPEPEPEPLMAMQSKTLTSTDAAVEEKTEYDEEESIAVGDTTLASTILSESTDGKLQSESNDTKTTTSPSATSPDPDKGTWAPFEFRNDSDIHDFNNARPFGDFEPGQTAHKGHKKSLSAAAQPFVPGGFVFGGPNPLAAPFEPTLKLQPQPMHEPSDSEDDRGASPTPGPEPRPAADTEVEPSPLTERQPSPVRMPAPAPAPKPRGGLGASRFAAASTPKSGLGASRFAEPSAEVVTEKTPVVDQTDDEDAGELTLGLNEPSSFTVSPPSDAANSLVQEHEYEPTFEEIDAVMQHMNENDPTMGVNRKVESPKWHQSSPVSNVPVVVGANSPVHLPTQSKFRSDAPSPSPRQYRTLPQEPLMLSKELQDPFVDPPQSAISQSFDAEGPVRQLGSGDAPESEWDDAFSASEQDKLEHRVQYFDGRVQELVDSLMVNRLDPLEKTLSAIQHALLTMSRRTPSSRRDRRSASAEIQHSDADDEDDEIPVTRLSMSPQRNKRVEQMRSVVLEALNSHHASRALQNAVEQASAAPPVDNLAILKELQDMRDTIRPPTVDNTAILEELQHMKETIQPPTVDNVSILKELQDMRETLRQQPQTDMTSESLRAIVEEAVQKQMPPPPPPVVQDDEEATIKMAEMQARILELEKSLRLEQDKVSNEVAARRDAQDQASDIARKLEQAETKIEVEIMNRSVYDQRVHDLEERLRLQESKTEGELHGRREAEDRLSEIQRLLRISSEEEDRLRSVLGDRDDKIKALEQTAGKSTMRLALLEAAQSNADKTQIDLTNRLNATDGELREARQEARHWRSEAEHARDSSRRQTDDLIQAVDEAKHLRKVIDTLNTQLAETERVREAWRAKFVSLQDDMAHAAREITEENSRRTKKEQALFARQEVLDARLQAESRTRERLEAELERLEGGERAGMRAVSECKRLETLLGEMRNENHKLQTTAMYFQREAKEAKEAAATETQRVRASAQAELDTATNQVNAVRAELEEEIVKVRSELAQAHLAADDLSARHEVLLEEELGKFRAQLDQVKLDADTAKVHHEMMLEGAHNTRAADLDDLTRKHQNEIEDLQARFDRQINNQTEDAQRTEQNLLERLSLSTSKTEHLQDRVAHLEDKLQIAQEAAKAAAQAAKAAGASEPVIQTSSSGKPAAVAQAMQLPEKISPQALRESIMVLQEQLQAREQRIEELEQTVSKLDPEAATKISKRDDEIVWLRELLAVRHSDLQDIIAALSAENFDIESVKEAAIRLKANLQMEEQERERAVNGGSAITDIAAAIRGAATPRVAQAVGPLAAAWGNWRKANQPTLNNLTSVLSSPAAVRNATPSKINPSPASQSSLLSGLMTPPASGLRNTPSVEQSKPQPTAFGNTGRRFTAEQYANRSRGPSLTSRQAEKMPMASTPPRRAPEQRGPVTPPQVRSSGYDSDAHIEDFDDAGFFDD
ncbi:hypothetical protein BX600DRAFT_513027 [Xylariales sp. PMI_506]|nr:hypothetical protein BX600DRAFT_513027 [Xylariales sp. PMI_506]